MGTLKILANHPNWQEEEQRQRDEKAEKDMDHFEIGGDR